MRVPSRADQFENSSNNFPGLLLLFVSYYQVLSYNNTCCFNTFFLKLYLTISTFRYTNNYRNFDRQSIIDISIDSRKLKNTKGSTKTKFGKKNH